MNNTDAELVFRNLLDAQLDLILDEPTEENFDIAEQMLRQYKKIMTEDN